VRLRGCAASDCCLEFIGTLRADRLQQSATGVDPSEGVEVLDGNVMRPPVAGVAKILHQG
jgi:hypothetical protein